MWNWLKHAFGKRRAPAGPRFVIHQRYELDLLPPSEYDAIRPFRILSYLEKKKLLKPGVLRRPWPVSLRRLQTVHDPEYLASLENPGALESIIGFPIDEEKQDRFLAFQRIVCGGTLEAARNALSHHGTTVNLGGGFHHAFPAGGSGFCVFNDVALAVMSLRRRGLTEPILIVDLDLHDGDGTRAYFADDPSVYTFDIHNHTLGSPAAVASTCLALGADVDDETYLTALRTHLPPVIEAVQPGFVFYIAGCDPAVEDKLGDWRISSDGLLARDRFVMEHLPAGVPRAILIGGGYGRRAWRHSAAFLSWLLTGDADLDIPLELELPIDYYRRLTRLMKVPRLLPDEWDARRKSSGDDSDSAGDWGLNDEDLGLGGARRPRLFLDLFSRHGVEMTLEGSGLLDRLRQRGLRDLRLTMDLDDPAGHTLRLLTADEEPMVVMEIRLRVDRAREPGRAYLILEWLLIQDAGSRFGMSEPLLPGQQYPGLGLLRDTGAMLVVLCEKLGLDGLVFTPSHFHLASLARPLARNRDPRREGRFLAVQRTLRGMRLREASDAVESGQVVDKRTGRPLIWEPAPLIIPVSRECRSWFESESYRLEVARSLTQFEFRLTDNR